jgi:hypothetical protein
MESETTEKAMKVTVGLSFFEKAKVIEDDLFPQYG